MKKSAAVNCLIYSSTSANFGKERKIRMRLRDRPALSSFRPFPHRSSSNFRKTTARQRSDAETNSKEIKYSGDTISPRRLLYRSTDGGGSNFLS